MRNLLIRQPAGLGDIFFSQKLVKSMIHHNKCDVIWPVIPQYSYISDYFYFQYIHYLSMDSEEFREDYEWDFNLIRKGDIITNRNITPKPEDQLLKNVYMGIGLDGMNLPNFGVMTSKYEFFRQTWNDWSNYFSFKRNWKKEEELYYFILGLKDNEEYIVINRKIGSPGHESYWNYCFPTNKKVIEIKEYPNITVFDWCKVLENASEFHIMETCFCYIIEILETKENEYVMYHRSPTNSNNFKELTKIYSKPKKHVGAECITKV